MTTQRNRARIGSVLVLAVLAASWFVAAGIRRPPCDVGCPVVPVRGVVGSEKSAFFADPEVIGVLRRHGLAVTVETAGSRTMSCRPDLGSLDFAFPGSPWAATATLEAAASQHPLDPSIRPVEIFESPVVVVTFASVARVLQPSGAVSNDFITFNMESYLNNVFFARKRWRDLAIGKPFPGLGRAVLMSTRLDTSNSAEQYLALVSYVVNHNRAITTGEASDVRGKVADLFRAQGSTGLSSEEPFEQYLSREGYQLPMQVAYEAQFLDASALRNRVLQPDGTEVELERIMLYPDPGISSVHTLVPLSAHGAELAHLLVSDARLRRLAARHGFRPVGDPGTFAAVVAEQNKGGVRLELPQPRAELPPSGVWNEFVADMVNDVYGKDRAGVGCDRT